MSSIDLHVEKYKLELKHWKH